MCDFSSQARRPIRSQVAVTAQPLAHAAPVVAFAMYAALLLAAPVAAQQGIAQFEERMHNFGVVDEGVDASHTFTFRNTGDAPIRLVQVRPSCGCTTPEWTQDAVAPGETGNVTAVYHSMGRPGPFNKSVAVFTDGEPEVLQLWISGDVSPSLLEGTRVGNLIVATDEARFPRISREAPAVATFRIQNAGSRAIRIDSVSSYTPALFTNYTDRSLNPGQTDEVTLILDTDDLRSGDRLSYEVTLITDDENEPEKRVLLTGVVE